MTSVTSPAPTAGVAESVTTFAYDLKGELTQITDLLGHITTLAYNPVGLISSITDPEQRHQLGIRFARQSHRLCAQLLTCGP